MWVKCFADGSKIMEGNGRTWLTTPLDGLVAVKLILPQEIFGRGRDRYTLSGSGPYHHAIKARATLGGRAHRIAEYIQRYNGKDWLTIEADYVSGRAKQYILPRKLGK